MNDSILISPGGAVRRAPVRRGSAMASLLRGRLLARLSQLQSGAVRLVDRAGDAICGDPRGALGTLTVRVDDPAFFAAVAFGGATGAGEAYTAGHWRCDDVVGLLRLFVRDRDVLRGVDRGPWSLPRRLLSRLVHRLRRNTAAGSRRNIADHYDLGDDLFARFLDPTMTYSSAWFVHPEQSLADAQLEKLRRLCRLVDLSPADRLLEIGTGWGSLAMTAARDFGACVTTTTISANQFEAARRRVAAAGLGDRVEVLRRDYRDLDGVHDKLLSCEMIEAVGADFLPTYLRTCARLLRPGGVLGLQAIVIDDRHYEAALRTVDYIKRHVFPGSFIPSIQAIHAAAARHTDLRLTRVEEFGLHYAETLRRWRRALLADPAPFVARGGEALVRAWEFYFAYCEAGFRERHIGVAHLRFERAGGLTR